MDDFKIPIQPQVQQNITSDINLDESDNIEVPEITAVTETLNADAECPYKTPPWSCKPPQNIELKFEILKSGQIIDEVKHLESKATWTFGRLPQNDIEMAHPTISRFHAVLQYRPANVQLENIKTDKPEPPEGWYIYDLGSTHGTYLNKQRVPARVFIRMHVGHMLKLGSSSRIFILQGPPEYEEPESKFSVTELREQRKANELRTAAEAKLRAEVEAAAARAQGEGVCWGMTEDADEETDLHHNPFAVTNNEDLFLDDPKRTLRGYFEREGLQLEYKCDEMSAGTFVCRVELPIDDENGRAIVAEVVHKGRKKDCVVQCALEACGILDRHGVLRQANKEPSKRRIKPQQSDSDDEFLDRTGDVARKKQRKMNSNSNVALTHEDLLKKDTEIVEQLEEVHRKISNYHEKQKQLKEVAKAQENSEDLDAYMENLNDAPAELDKTEIRKLRLEQQHLKSEQEKTKRLLQITKPIGLTFVTENTSSSKSVPQKKQMPLIGKRNQFSKFKIVKPKIENTKQKLVEERLLASDEEEVEDDLEIKESDEKIATQTSNKTIKLYGPALIPQEFLETQPSSDSKESSQNTQKTQDLDEGEKIVNESDNVQIKENEKNTGMETKNTLSDGATKKRQRSRKNPHIREELNLNELEEHETTEKYAKWVPPENQIGDGFTELNKKYGY